jgi:tetratricopeptide (TPR) repeat protein
MRLLLVLTAILSLFPVFFAHAQMTQKIIIRDGKIVAGDKQNSGNVALSEAQQLIFKAQQSLMKGDFASAEALYSEAIARDSSNVQAYLHRGVVRRERHEWRGVDADARMAVTLANGTIQANPRDPDGYYDRSLALRLLQQYDLAKKDVQTAIQLGGKASLRNDLQAIELERKMALSAAQTAAR